MRRLIITFCFLAAVGCASEQVDTQKGSRENQKLLKDHQISNSFETVPKNLPSMDDPVEVDSPGALTLFSNSEINFPNISWKRSLEIGSTDQNGKLLGGTELRTLQSFDGKLFAANGYWTDRYAREAWLPGGQVFRLDKPVSQGGKWVVDLHLEDRMPNSNLRRFHTISDMKAVRFTTDGNGRPLAKPVEILIVSVWDRSTGLHVFTRDTSGPASWQKSTIVADSGASAPWHVRSFALHRDAVTRVDYVFAGTSGSARVPRGIYRGAYDPSVSGKIRWLVDQEPWDRVPGPEDRVMSMTVANGKLYATVCGKLYERKDGQQPQWLLKYRHARDYCPTTPGEWSYRGATTINNPDGTQSIITAMEGTSIFGRWDFGETIRGFRELALVPFLARGLQRPNILYTIAAYSGFAKISATDGRVFHLAGIEALIGDGQPNTWHGWQRGAWFIARSQKATFKLYHIPPDGNEGAMVAVRAMIQSPFPSEPNAIYAGGFDANHVEHVNHNTAWLYRGELVP
ncbi:MAG: hypothetical protein RLZ25_1639 [Pseudomonadota bacterium]|jgi:hypothetical protein